MNADVRCLGTGGTGAAGTPGTSLAAGRTIWFEALGNVNASAAGGRCLGHEQDSSNAAACTTGHDFIQSYDVPATTLTGSVTSIFAEVQTAPGVGNTLTATVRVNNTDSTLSCSITGTATSCEATGAAAFVAGDFIRVHVTATAGTPNIGWKTYLTLSTVAP